DPAAGRGSNRHLAAATRTRPVLRSSRAHRARRRHAAPDPDVDPHDARASGTALVPPTGHDRHGAIAMATARNTVVSGARPTGQLHLGNLHGAIKNWLTLQQEHDCFFFVADWHALTTDWAESRDIGRNTLEM